MGALPLNGPGGVEYVVTNFRPAEGSGNLARQARKVEADFRKQVDARGGFLERVNRRSLQYIQTQALENLRNSMKANRRPGFSSDSFRSKTDNLESAILNGEYSNADNEKIEFLIRSKIFPKVPYYASLEFGDDSQVGRKIPFLFLGARSGLTSANRSSDDRRIFNKRHSPSSLRNNLNPDRSVRRVEPKYRDTHTGIPARTKNGTSDRLVGVREYDKKYGDGSGDRHELGDRFLVTIRRPVPAYRYGTRAGNQFVTSKSYRDFLLAEAAEFLQDTGVSLKT